MAIAARLFRSHPVGSDPDAKREHWSRQDARRGSAASRGYDRQWRNYRAVFLAEHPLCVECEKRREITPATVVDHITPHRGDKGLFWDEANHQALCKPCHDRKTIIEDVGIAGGCNWHPPFLRPSAVPLTIVCGPPLAGKSMFVDERCQVGDTVIDLDIIGAEVCGTGLHDWPLSRINELGRERNRRLLALSTASAGKAWLIVGEPTAAKRAWWHETMQADEVVVLETPRHVCASRAEAERSQPDRVIGAIERWWLEYGRRPGETVVAHSPGPGGGSNPSGLSA